MALLIWNRKFQPAALDEFTETSLTIPGTLGGVSAALSGFGKVLQIVSATDSTSQAGTTSFANTPLTATITPSSSTSKVVCIVTVSLDITQSSTAATISDLVGRVSCSGGASGTLPVVANVAFDTRSRGTMFGQSFMGMQTIVNVHTPATTSAVTYTLQIKAGTGTNCTHSYNNWGNVSGIVLVEVAA